MYLPEAARIEDFLYRELQKHWSTKLVNVRERLRLIPDLYKWKPEDPYFHAQKQGKVPQHYCIYFDNEFVCGFDSTYLPEAVLLVFWKGLLPLYNEHKIYFDKGLYKAEEEWDKDVKKAEKHKKKERIRKLDIPAEAKEVISKLEEEQ